MIILWAIKGIFTLDNYISIQVETIPMLRFKVLQNSYVMYYKSYATNPFINGGNRIAFKFFFKESKELKILEI